VYSKIEAVRDASEISHPAARAVLEFLRPAGGVEIHHDGDLPARSGMGSSSAFTVGLLHAIHALQGHLVSKEQLAAEGIRIEQAILNETVGSQDQVMAAHGGLNHVTFRPDGEIIVRPLTVAPERIHTLNDHLMLFYTGIRRTASDVAKSYVGDIGSKNTQLARMSELVKESIAILCGGGPIAALGALFNEAWHLKRSLSNQVTNAKVDAIYDAALNSGALGGKLIGAGGGGFMLLFVPPQHQADVRERLAKLLLIPFRFESRGSQIIFYDPDLDYSAAERDRANRAIECFHELEPRPAP